MKRIGRNNPCPCGSGKKYKKCCMDKEQQEKQIILENDIKPDHKIPPLEISPVDDMSTDEEQNIFDEFWDKYETVDFDEKVSMIEETYNNPSLMDADFVYEILNELSKSATTKLERETYTRMVKRLKENHSKIYEKEAGYLLDYCVGNAIIDKQMSELKPLFLEYASFAYKTIDIFNLRVDQLAYHGHLELLKEGFRIGWRKVENSGDILPWGIDEFAERGSDFELFSYLQNASNRRADDELLINRIEYYVDLDKKLFNKYFASITRTDAPTWRYEDFDINPKVLKKDELSDYVHNISNLCNEFLDFMHIEGEKAYPKAELMRTENMRNNLPFFIEIPC